MARIILIAALLLAGCGSPHSGDLNTQKECPPDKPGISVLMFPYVPIDVSDLSEPDATKVCTQ